MSSPTDKTDAELVREIYDYKDGRLYLRRSGRVVGSQTPRGYRVVMFRGKARLEHLVIWLWHYGEWPPKGMYVDHIDGLRFRNDISNLRIVTPRQNRANWHRFDKAEKTWHD